jgi:predicted LPLAT superfamily acyltransferase
VLPRNSREQALRDVVGRFAERLEHYVRLAPYNWFNFYDFWSIS